MESNVSQPVDTIPFSKLNAVEQVGAILGGALALAVFGLFFYFVWWKMIRSYIQTPKEPAGIRAAMERIADALEKRNV
jgi:hypothetical protein